MFAYFLWLNSEGRDKIKVYFRVHHIQVKISCIVGGKPRLLRDIVIKEEMWAKIDSDTKECLEEKARTAKKEKYEEEYKVTRLVLILVVNC